jgi:hypothetical protein
MSFGIEKLGNVLTFKQNPITRTFNTDVLDSVTENFIYYPNLDNTYLNCKSNPTKDKCIENGEPFIFKNIEGYYIISTTGKKYPITNVLTYKIIKEYVNVQKTIEGQKKVIKVQVNAKFKCDRKDEIIIQKITEEGGRIVVEGTTTNKPYKYLKVDVKSCINALYPNQKTLSQKELSSTARIEVSINDLPKDKCIDKNNTPIPDGEGANPLVRITESDGKTFGLYKLIVFACMDDNISITQYKKLNNSLDEEGPEINEEKNIKKNNIELIEKITDFPNGIIVKNINNNYYYLIIGQYKILDQIYYNLVRIIINNSDELIESDSINNVISSDYQINNRIVYLYTLIIWNKIYDKNKKLNDAEKISLKDNVLLKIKIQKIKDFYKTLIEQIINTENDKISQPEPEVLLPPESLKISDTMTQEQTGIRNELYTTIGFPGGICSGLFINNIDEFGYILSAAHCAGDIDNREIINQIKIKDTVLDISTFKPEQIEFGYKEAAKQLDQDKDLLLIKVKHNIPEINDKIYILDNPEELQSGQKVFFKGNKSNETEMIIQDKSDEYITNYIPGIPADDIKLNVKSYIKQHMIFASPPLGESDSGGMLVLTTSDNKLILAGVVSNKGGIKDVTRFVTIKSLLDKFPDELKLKLSLVKINSDKTFKKINESEKNPLIVLPEFKRIYNCDYKTDDYIKKIDDKTILKVTKVEYTEYDNKPSNPNCTEITAKNINGEEKIFRDLTTIIKATNEEVIASGFPQAPPAGAGRKKYHRPQTRMNVRNRTRRNHKH